MSHPSGTVDVCSMCAQRVRVLKPGDRTNSSASYAMLPSQASPAKGCLCNFFVLETAPWSHSWELCSRSSPHVSFHHYIHALCQAVARQEALEEPLREVGDYLPLCHVLCPWQHLNFAYSNGCSYNLSPGVSCQGWAEDSPPWWCERLWIHCISSLHSLSSAGVGEGLFH